MWSLAGAVRVIGGCRPESMIGCMTSLLSREPLTIFLGSVCCVQCDRHALVTIGFAYYDLIESWS